MPDATSPVAARWIQRWLIIIALMVYAMILIGGATRLTDSGLSITEWEPIKGTLPPLSDAAWAIEFEKYKSTAEFQQQNYNMTMGEFQYIYWWEWGHRLFGRLIGLVAIIGFLCFAVLNWLSSKWMLRLTGLIALGGLQGFIGWWMVASGIGETDRLDVAPYRLMTHFGLALLIIAITVWFWLDLSERKRMIASRGTHLLAVTLFVLTSIQMLTGALVAGLDAGRSYTDWPLMAGELVPSHYLDAELGVRSLFEGRAATQFNHRLGAYVLLGLALYAAWRTRKLAVFPGFGLIAVLVIAQAVWGIVTLVNAAPLPIALVHQGLGVIVLLSSVWLVWATRSPSQSTPQMAAA